MRSFLQILFMWLILTFTGLFFFGAYLLTHVYAMALLAALAAAVLTHVLMRQSDRIEALEARIRQLEQTNENA